jgi:stearoyl-CoA desaturase (delta-9 desaturase)
MSFVFIIFLLVVHWYGSLFFQTVFLHRYAAHQMFSLTPLMERLFYLGTFLTQGSSFLNPRAYAILHKMHHQYSDSPRDPHSPVQVSNVITMMKKTLDIFMDIQRNPQKYSKYQTQVRPWPTLDYLADTWTVRILYGALWVLLYLSFVDYWWQLLVVPLHWFMGPLHGAIVNWCGHKYGYSSFDNGDKSKNSLPIDFLMMGELYQNNHHKFPNSLKFSVRKFEWDPGFTSLLILNKLGIVKLAKITQEKN